MTPRMVASTGLTWLTTSLLPRTSRVVAGVAGVFLLSAVVDMWVEGTFCTWPTLAVALESAGWVLCLAAIAAAGTTILFQHKLPRSAWVGLGANAVLIAIYLVVSSGHMHPCGGALAL